MPELPEITLLADQLDTAISGLRIDGVHVTQPKCLNVAPGELAQGLRDCTVSGARACGKWVMLALSNDRELALNLGMGGEILLLGPGATEPTGKVAIRVGLCPAHQLTIGFWWFGHVHLLPADGAPEHPTRNLGPGALALELPEFAALVRRCAATGIKSLLLNQKRIAGIGNVYNQDALWAAGIHPLRRAGSLSTVEVSRLHSALQEHLRHAMDCGGSEQELDLYGNPGHFGRAQFRVAYRPDKPCPRCQTSIVKIKTGGTSSHICPTCQPAR